MTAAAPIRELTQLQRVTAGRAAYGFWASNPAELVTVSVAGLFVVCATEVQAQRWKGQDFGVPTEVRAVRSLLGGVA